MQTTPEGGFAGRPNKLVDACYSHWVGACFALLEAALPAEETQPQHAVTATKAEERQGLWNKAALVRYLLTCAQQPGKKGGMRDKPSARPDGYHTCYSLSGLSAAQHRYWYDERSGTRGEEEEEEESGDRLLAAFNWRGERGTAEEMRGLGVDGEDVVELVHPVFVLRFEAVEWARKRFAGGGV
ncbi:CAAX farnesyltransferase (FTase) subunit beta [Friedmanniomyces endolithicus]|nr:CAAX farnesyltransferase (FTase) subunit beta [Friedmanniomyces endolithicus]